MAIHESADWDKDFCLFTPEELAMGRMDRGGEAGHVG
jgi:hypothetical protein